jgi:hypothetical protein
MLPLLGALALLGAGIRRPPPVNGRASSPRPLARAALRRAQVQTVYAGLPLAFEAVPGAAGEPARYYAAGSGYGLLLSPTEAMLAVRPARRAVTGRAPSVRSEHPSSQAAALAGAARCLTRSRPLPPPAWLRLQWRGASPCARAAALEELPGKVNRYAGQDPRRWRLGIPTYARVCYEGVYPGIDLLYYGNQGRLEYDWVVAPGADLARIRLAVQGARSVTVDGRGDLVLQTAGETIRQPAPRLYQELAGRRKIIEGSYRLAGKNEVRFAVGAYDRRRPLIIDPTLVYSTYLGAGAGASGIAVDPAGNVWVTGVTASPSAFPTTPGALQSRSSAQGGPSDLWPSGAGVFVVKLDLTRSGAGALVYSTYIGGDDVSTGIALDAAGEAFITGITSSQSFPTTPGALQPKLAPGFLKAFVVKLSPTGALDYATYLGDLARTFGDSQWLAVAADAVGNAYLTGHTESVDFPTTPSAVQPIRMGPGHAFVSRLDPAGKLIYSVLLGGSAGEYARAIAVDGAGNAAVTGMTNSLDFPTTANAIQREIPPFSVSAPLGGRLLISDNAFVARLSPSGAVLYSTLLGGAGGRTDGQAIAVDGAGDIYAAGLSGSPNLPVTPGAFQSIGGGLNVFVGKIASTGALAYLTYLRGGGDAGGIAVDAAGDAFLTGDTDDPGFPVTPSGFQTHIGRGADGKPAWDAYVVILEPAGKFLYYSTFLGGSGYDAPSGIALDGKGSIYVAGSTESPDFPTTPGALQSSFEPPPGGSSGPAAFPGRINAFVARIALSP